MARFCAYRLADGTYILDCQSDLLDHLTTRFVVPLVPIAQVQVPIARLNPHFNVEGQTLVMMTQFAGAVPARSLGPIILSLEHEEDAIATALDMLLVGF